MSDDDTDFSAWTRTPALWTKDGPAREVAHLAEAMAAVGIETSIPDPGSGLGGGRRCRSANS